MRQRRWIAAVMALVMVVGLIGVALAHSATGGEDASTATTVTAAPRSSQPASLVADTTTTPAPPASSSSSTGSSGSSASSASSHGVSSSALPAHSGSGQRIVYANKAERVWIVGSDGSVLRTYPVSGRAHIPNPGTYHVYSKSVHTNAVTNVHETMDYMVRFTRAWNGTPVGFHTIPKINGVPVQSLDQLGTPLSASCIRQATPDAIYLYNFAAVGTTVVVLA
jgi:lipoprotein-anchoring transpeptidase ErfK/SrfK